MRSSENREFFQSIDARRNKISILTQIGKLKKIETTPKSQTGTAGGTRLHQI